MKSTILALIALQAALCPQDAGKPYLFHMSVTPDGKHLAVGFAQDCYHGEVGVLELESGKRVRSFPAVPTNVTATALSPDAKTFVTAFTSIKVIDFETGAVLREFGDHAQPVDVIAFSPDAKFVITVAAMDRDKPIAVWDLATGKEVLTFKGHDGRPRCCVVTPDGQHVISGADPWIVRNGVPSGGDVKIWRLADGKEVATLVESSEGVRSLALSPDGKTLAIGFNDNSAALWDVKTRKRIRGLSEKAPGFLVGDVTFSGGGKFVAATSGVWGVLGGAGPSPEAIRRHRNARIWSVSDGKLSRTISIPDTAIDRIEFTADENVVITLSAGNITLWDVSTGKSIRKLK